LVKSNFHTIYCICFVNCIYYIVQVQPNNSYMYATWAWCQMINCHEIQSIQGNIWSMKWQLINRSIRKGSRTVFWDNTKNQPSYIRCHEKLTVTRITVRKHQTKHFSTMGDPWRKKIRAQIRSNSKPGVQSTLFPAKKQKVEGHNWWQTWWLSLARWKY
jgi:hypothetical protein